MNLAYRFAVAAFTASPAQSNTRIANNQQLNQPQSTTMPRPSKRQLASRAILAEAWQTKKAKIGGLGEVEEVVGAAIVKRESENDSDSDSYDESEVGVSDNEELSLEFNR